MWYIIGCWGTKRDFEFLFVETNSWLSLEALFRVRIKILLVDGFSSLEGNFKPKFIGFPFIWDFHFASKVLLIHFNNFLQLFSLVFFFFICIFLLSLWSFGCWGFEVMISQGGSKETFFRFSFNFCQGFLFFEGWHWRNLWI